MSLLLLLSPAKKQLAETPAISCRMTQPRLKDNTALLVNYLKKLDAKTLSNELGISDKLAQLNHQRYQQFDVNHYRQTNATPALWTFQGDVYRQLDAATLNSSAITYAQKHLRLLSALYGLLRPLDLIQPYRLEMSCKLSNKKFNTLYHFWQEKITALLNRDSDNKTTLINLASSEYSSAINQETLQAPIITIGFRQQRQGQIKNIGLKAKRARGQMARFIIERQLQKVDAIKRFTCEGYQFTDSLSNEQNWVFVTKQ